MVADYERTRDALVRICGLRVLEDSRIEDPAIGRRGGMAWLGDNIIEIGEPIVVGGAVDRFVSRFGSHMSSIAVQVDDIAATRRFLESRDVELGALIDDHIMFTPPAGTAGVVIEWFDREEADDPRFGGAVPALAVEPVLEVTAMAFGGAVVHDPAATAQRLAELFGHGIAFVDDSAPPGSPVAGVSLGDLVLALYSIPEPSESQRLWAWTYERPQTSNLGLLVPDLSKALGALATARVPVLRHDDSSITIAPEVTGGVIVVLVDELLPGDPRL
jgi:catechol 2,3-dioxygenase-like lactoylglutathione lyase family enzyme